MVSTSELGQRVKHPCVLPVLLSRFGVGKDSNRHGGAPSESFNVSKSPTESCKSHLKSREPHEHPMAVDPLNRLHGIHSSRVEY
jgi:hypothetical protein